MIVFVYDIERNVFGSSAQRRQLNSVQNFDPLLIFQAKRCLRYLAVGPYLPLVDEPLHARPAYLPKPGYEELIETFSDIFSFNR
jgi:hypothetical protein